MNYFSASRWQTVGGLAAVVTLALIATSGFWHQAEVRQTQPDPTIVMSRDVNGELAHQALAEIRDAYADASNGDISRSSTIAQVNQLNQTLGKIDKSKLQPQQKQELDTLQGQYQALVFERLQPSGSLTGGEKARVTQTQFFNTYASYLAKDGERLTVSPEVSLKSDKTKTYVIGWSDTPDVKKTAASNAVRDLQTRIPEMALEYKVAPTAAAAAQSPATPRSD